VRLFVAVLLPERVRAALASEVERMRAVTRGVAWVAGTNLHVTLKFLGEVDAARVDAVTTALNGAAAAVAPFTVELSGLGAFPTPLRPRVLWAGIASGVPAMTTLAARVEAALAGCGFAPDDRPFAAHVTLGRVREPRRDPALAAEIERAARQPFGEIMVDRIVLVRSELSPRGARYSEVSAAPLTGA
jgi:2'-5' RNA ligase